MIKKVIIAILITICLTVAVFARETLIVQTKDGNFPFTELPETRETRTLLRDLGNDAWEPATQGMTTRERSVFQSNMRRFTTVKRLIAEVEKSGPLVSETALFRYIARDGSTTYIWFRPTLNQYLITVIRPDPVTVELPILGNMPVVGSLPEVQELPGE